MGIPTITTAITNALAAIGLGRSLPINVESEVEERKENLERALNQLQSAEMKFKNALGDHAEDRKFLLTLIRDAIRNAIIAQIQAFLSSLLPAGRAMKVENKQLLWQLLNGGGTIQATSSSTTTTVNPLEALLNGDGTLLESFVSGSSEGSLLESFLSGSGGTTGELSLLSLLGGSTDGGTLLDSFLSGSSSGGLIETIIQQQMEAQMEAMLNEIISSNGGLEEIMALMGINGGMEEIMSLAGMTGGLDGMMSGLAAEMEGSFAEMEAMMTEMEGMMNGGMEQFMTEMMTEMGMNGDMEAMMNELMAEMGTMGEMPEYIDLPPLQCDCVPNDDMTTLNG